MDCLRSVKHRQCGVVSAAITATQSCQCFAGLRTSHGTDAWSLGLKWGGRDEEEEEERGKPLKDFCNGVANRLLLWMMKPFYENDFKAGK